MIDTQEREAVIGALRASEARLLDLLRELAPAHQRFREAPTGNRECRPRNRARSERK